MTCPNGVTALAALLLSTGAALAQSDVTLMTARDAAHGSFLIDRGGRPLYAFTADTRGSGERRPEVACADACLEAWRPVHALGGAHAADAVRPGLIGEVPHDGARMVTYNGWPLYRFTGDEVYHEVVEGEVPGRFETETPGMAEGHGVESFGGSWSLVAPSGALIDGP